MAVLIINCTVTVKRSADNSVLASGVVGSMQRDKRGTLPALLAGRGQGGLDLSFCWQVLIDMPGALPGIGDVVTVSSFSGAPMLATDWILWDEPQLDPLFGTCLMFVKKKL